MVRFGRKKNRHRIYAICFVDEGMRVVLSTDWDEAEELMKGKPHLVKRIRSKTELKEWYDGISYKDIWRARHYSKVNREEN